MLTAAALSFDPGTASSQILPWEVNVAEIESGRLRYLGERLSKQNLLYQFHLGNVTKADLVDTASQIDHVLGSLEKGSPSYSIPAPWTPSLREQVGRVDSVWGPLRSMAVASPYDYFRLTRQFMPAENSGNDPLLLRHFDNQCQQLIRESELLLGLYHEECEKTGLAVCSTARTSGYAAMLIERATKEAVYIVAGIDVEQNRARLGESLELYRGVQKANDADPFFAEALDPERSASAKAAGELFASLRRDWEQMRREFTILAAGDEQNFDLESLLRIQRRLVAKIDRLAAALVRYASLAYGS
jgi:hypothetical protein